MHITTFLHQFSYYCLGKKLRFFVHSLNSLVWKLLLLKSAQIPVFRKNHFTTWAKGKSKHWQTFNKHRSWSTSSQQQCHLAYINLNTVFSTNPGVGTCHFPSQSHIKSLTKSWKNKTFLYLETGNRAKVKQELTGLKNVWNKNYSGSGSSEAACINGGEHFLPD